MTLVYSVRAEMRRQNTSLLYLNWECVHLVTLIFCCSMDVYNGLGNSINMNLGVINKH